MMITIIIFPARRVGTYRRCHVFVSLLVSTAFLLPLHLCNGLRSSFYYNYYSRKRTIHPTSTDEDLKRQRQQDHNEEDKDSRLRVTDLAAETDISTDNIAHSHTLAYDVNFVYRSPCVMQVERQNLFLHEQARQSPTSSGAPSSTAFDKHLVDS